MLLPEPMFPSSSHGGLLRPILLGLLGSAHSDTYCAYLSTACTLRYPAIHLLFWWHCLFYSFFSVDLPSHTRARDTGDRLGRGTRRRPAAVATALRVE
eukprot:3258733-Pleurochrysis_carterae.AAC.1